MLILAGVVSKDGESGSMARPLEVVHSGKTTMVRLGCLCSNACRVVRSASLGGFSCGGESVSNKACSKEIRRINRVEG